MLSADDEALYSGDTRTPSKKRLVEEDEEHRGTAGSCVIDRNADRLEHEDEHLPNRHADPQLAPSNAVDCVPLLEQSEY